MTAIHSKIFFLLILLVVVTGCGRESEVPSHLIQQDQMTQLMADVHVIEAWLAKVPRDQQSPEIREYAYTKLLQSYGIRESTFDESLQFYLDNAHLFQSIYPEIIEILSEEEGKRKLD